MFLVIALGKIGIRVTPFVAAIGAASLGAGLETFRHPLSPFLQVAIPWIRRMERVTLA